MNQTRDPVEPARLRITRSGPEGTLRPAEVYYLEEDWLICCRFLDVKPTGGGECLTLGDSLVFDVEADGQPYFIEFLEGRWKITDSFSIPEDCEKGRVAFILPVDAWHPYPEVVSDTKMKNICIYLSREPVSKNIHVAEDVIFSFDEKDYLHRVWLLDIETRKES